MAGEYRFLTALGRMAKGAFASGDKGPRLAQVVCDAAPHQPSNYQAIFLSLEAGKYVDKVWKNHIFHPPPLLLNRRVMVAQAGAKGPLGAVLGAGTAPMSFPRHTPRLGLPSLLSLSGTQPPLNSWGRSWPWLAGIAGTSSYVCLCLCSV